MLYNDCSVCNKYWCEWFLEANWTDGMCIKIINNSVISNITGNETFANSTINDSEIKEYCRNYTDFYIRELRNSLVDRIENITFSTYYDDSGTSTQESWPWYTIPLTALILMAGLGFLAWSSFNKKQKPKIQQFQREFKQVQNRNDEKKIDG